MVQLNDLTISREKFRNFDKDYSDLTIEGRKFCEIRMKEIEDILQKEQQDPIFIELKTKFEQGDIDQIQIAELAVKAQQLEEFETAVAANLKVKY